MGAARHRVEVGTSIRAAALAFALLVLPGLRSVQAASRSCAAHRGPQLRCHEASRGADGHSTARACCGRGHGLSAAFCGCEHRGDPSSVADDEYVPAKALRQGIVRGIGAFRASGPRGFGRTADPPDPPPPIGSSPTRS